MRMNKYCSILLFVVLMFNFSTIESTLELNQLQVEASNKKTVIKPEEIVKISKNTTPYEGKMSLDLKENDPVKLMKLKVFILILKIGRNDKFIHEKEAKRKFVEKKKNQD